MKNKIILILIFVIYTLVAYPCTIGIASPTITASGKPILWKSRDIGPNTINTIRYVDNLTYNFVGISTPGENRVWMGVNEMGLSIANSLSNDLTIDEGTFNNGNLIFNSLGLFASLSEFEDYLEFLVNSNLDLELRGNFVAFDSTGTTKLYEINNNNFWIFETEDEIQPYLLRTNHSVNGGGIDGIERLIRSNTIIGILVESNELSVNKLLTKHVRDVSDIFSQPYDLPWQYGDPTPLLNTTYSINRANTISAVVIEGIQAGQSPQLTTMWLIMGNPFTTYAIPLLPNLRPNFSNINNISENSPELVNILWDSDNSFYLDTSKFIKPNFSLLSELESNENRIYSSFEELKTQWVSDEITNTQITSYINQEVESALVFSSELFYNFTPNSNNDITPLLTLKIYPNPFTTNLTIETKAKQPDNGSVKIYNIRGQLVKNIKSLPDNISKWNGENNANQPLPPGIYLIKYESDRESVTRKVVLMK